LTEAASYRETAVMHTFLGRNKKLVVIFVCAVVVRLIQVFLVYTISGDGPIYIEIAKNFYQGDFRGGLAFEYPPAYPLFISAAYSVTRDWLIAGRLVSFIFGILTIFPIYFMTKELFGEKVANLTSVFFVFQPLVSNYAVRVISEPTYVFFFVCAVWLSWKAISGFIYPLYFAAGAMSGFSYLIRPEGLGVAIVSCLCILFYDLLNIKQNYKRKTAQICVLALGVLVFVSPYVLHIKNETGQWKLSKKKSIVTAITGETLGDSITDASVQAWARIPAYSSMEEGYLKTFLGLIIVFVITFHCLLFLLLIICLVGRKEISVQGRYEMFICLIIIFYFLVFSLFYVSDRHLIPLVSICLFWSAIGFYVVYRYILKKIPPRKIEKMPKLPGRIFALLLMVVILSLLPQAMRPQDRDKIGRKKVGLWMRENCEKSPCIFTDSLRLAFYAGAEAVRFQNRPGIDKYEDLIKFVTSSKKGIDYIVIDKSTIWRYCPDFLDSINSSDLEVIHIQPKLEHSAYGELIVYKVK